MSHDKALPSCRSEESGAVPDVVRARKEPGGAWALGVERGKLKVGTQKTGGQELALEQQGPFPALGLRSG